MVFEHQPSSTIIYLQTPNTIPCLSQHTKTDNQNGLNMENHTSYLRSILPDSFKCYYCGKANTTIHSLDALGSKLVYKLVRHWGSPSQKLKYMHLFQNPFTKHMLE